MLSKNFASHQVIVIYTLYKIKAISTVIFSAEPPTAHKIIKLTWCDGKS